GRALRLTNVARDLRSADDDAGGVAHGRYAERHLDALAVLGHADGLEVADALATAQPREDLGLFVSTLGRNEHHDRLSDGLGRGVAEQTLRSRIEGANRA